MQNSVFFEGSQTIGKKEYRPGYLKNGFVFELILEYKISNRPERIQKDWILWKLLAVAGKNFPETLISNRTNII